MRRYFLVAARYSRASGQSAASIEELVCRRQVASVGARAPPDGGGLQVITNRIDGERGGVPDQGARSRGRINKADINNSRYLASQMGEPGAHPIWPIGAARQSGQTDCNHSSAGRPARGGSAHIARKSLLLAQVLELADTPSFSSSPRRRADNRPPLPSWAQPRRPGLLPGATRTRRKPRLENSAQARSGA